MPCATQLTAERPSGRPAEALRTDVTCPKMVRSRATGRQGSSFCTGWSGLL